MRIWHQSMTVLEDLPAYKALIEAHARKVLRPDTEVVPHGLAKDTYPGDYPGDDISYAALYEMHSQQWLAYAWRAQKEKYDAFAVCTMLDPLLREIRTMVDIPVVGCAESCFLLAPMFGQRVAVAMPSIRTRPDLMCGIAFPGLLMPAGTWPAATSWSACACPL